MGFLGKIFGNKEVAAISLKSPLNGEILERSTIPDPTFRDEILGPTLCFKPGADHTIYAPCDGVITQIFKTGHAVTITSKDKVEILIHVGINTVDLKGEGFTPLVQDDDEVKAGQPLIQFDGDLITKKGFSTLVPFVICNASDFKACNFIEPRAVTLRDEVCSLIPLDD